MRSISWHKGLIAAVAILVALIGVGFGLLRPVTYEASATLQVGQVNPNSPGFFSYTQSASSLATAFSRSVAAEPVLDKIEKKLDLPAAESTSRLTSAPIPLSPAFRVIATGPTRSAAIDLANVAAVSVKGYVNDSNRANPEAAALLAEYRSASLADKQASAKVAELEGGSSDELLGAEAKRSATRVRLKAIETAYISTVSSEAPRAGLVSVLAGATSASGDRTSKVELFGFLGLLIGLALGCLLAVLIEQRREAAA
jgi:uncharacterized protein involved in exopolysaccharide biosynthesis